MKKVLVVCTGNTCRSPMAAGWLNGKLANKRWAAESAGVAAWDGSPASPEAIEAMREIGVDISAHRSRRLTQAIADGANIILAATEAHRQDILRKFPETAPKTFLLDSFGVAPPRDIADPVGLPLDAYRCVRAELVRALGDFLLHLVERGDFQ